MIKILILWLVSFTLLANQYDWRTAYNNAYTYDLYRKLYVKPYHVKPNILKKIINRRYRVEDKEIEEDFGNFEEPDCEDTDCN